MSIITTIKSEPSPEARKITRPPGALSDLLLEDVCTGCGDCVEVCPGALLLLDRDGFPQVISERLCPSCGLCAEVCTQGAIRFTPRTRAGLRRVIAAEQGTQGRI